jgi:hypothetical protein
MKLAITRSGSWIALAVLAMGGMRLEAQGNPQFGMIGLAAGQTLRLNVVAWPPDPCNAIIGFLNINGVAPPNSVAKTVSLIPGQAAFVDLTAASLGILFGQRREFQPVVTLTPVNDSPSRCAVSAEIIDTASGLSMVAIPQPPLSMPNVSPQFGMAGIGLGQVLRLNVVAYPPDPCFGSIGFRDSSGQVLLPGLKNVSLNPGSADFVDLTAASLGVQFGQRMELQPVVMVTPGPNGASACQASAEVFEVFTSRTLAVLTPQP